MNEVIDSMPRVLIVDDDADLRRLVDMRLRMSGLETVLVADGASALEVLTTQSIDVVILDVMLPEMDGLETCRRIRQDLGLIDLTIILLTARVRGADIEAGLAAGASQYLVKPFSPRELLGRVVSSLGAAA